MKIVFAFPPPASPTYVPQGIASLCGWVGKRFPDMALRAVDLNLMAWRELIPDPQGGSGFWSFMQGPQEKFLDESAYLEEQPHLNRVWEVLRDRGRQTSEYLKTGRCPPGLSGWLDPMCTALCQDHPEYIGLSAMYLDQVPFALALARRMEHVCGELPVPKILLGGAALSALHPGELMEACGFIHAVITGEGEVPLTMVLEGAPLEAIPGVICRGSSSLPVPEVLPLLLNSLPAPDFSVLEIGRYANPVSVLPLSFSRGCKWDRCRFCAHNFSFGVYREKTAVQFVDEMEGCTQSFGARHFYIVDQFVPAPRLEALSREILARGLSVFFHVMARPTSDYTPARLELAAAAGCCWISWGIESGSQRLLNLVRKGTSAGAAEKAVRDASEAGITNLLMLIFGLPTSAEADFNATMAFLERVHGAASAVTSSSFVLFEHTHFARHPRQYRLEVNGHVPACETGGRMISSGRLIHRHTADEAGVTTNPAGEIAAWERRREWLGGKPFLETLQCEHFLLFSAARLEAARKRPARPRVPRRRAA